MNCSENERLRLDDRPIRPLLIFDTILLSLIAALSMLLAAVLSGCTRTEVGDDLGRLLHDVFDSSVIWAFEVSEGSITSSSHGSDAVAVRITRSDGLEQALVSLDAHTGAIAGTEQTASRALYWSVGFLAQADQETLVLYDQNLRQVRIETANLPDGSHPLDTVSLKGLHYVLNRDANVVYVTALDNSANVIWRTEIPSHEGGTEAMMVHTMLEPLDDNTIMVYGTSVPGLVAIGAEDGSLLWSYVPEGGMEKRVSSVSVGDSGLLITAIVNKATHYGEVSLLTVTGDELWTVEMEYPAFVAQIVREQEEESYWCLAGVGEGSGPAGGNSLLQVFPDGSSMEVLSQVAYEGPTSVIWTAVGLVACGHEDGTICIVKPGQEPRSVRYAEPSLYRRSRLLGASSDSAFICLSRDTSDLTIVACVALSGD